MLVWIREQDGPRAKKTLTRITILMVLFLPGFALQQNSYDEIKTESTYGLGLFGGIFICALLGILAFQSDRKITRRFDYF